ncbi:helicase-related protein [Phocaeicola coprocola]|uniref:helicase-related protein n=1 Tax=Phocaeicola coprocola TaxID=310298 RepID=UPI001C3890C5|nr:helicase-related protein [Phocaeicola coprocola]MBV3865672.1 DEAD/DEAH box helicase family protein [Phocaeicola coprocola]MBV4006579.1 DEAD/DEAH box helicase family protein [Phocaeicola coprocola]MBV4031277.1 DEAD/DEAH box helicase family protein [Phocaeicola coprocola]MBV4037865.1 DEAD/DEAH box helicase family protein [Phocaeicola coprocola]MBV4059506.1 DEAD/DEAH box helicase family protein [Phocaeicola coprocola]
MRVPKQFNNITERVIDDLKQLLLSDNSQISIAAASFSIYAYEALKEELEKVDCVNFIFTSPTFYTDKSEKQKREFYIPKLNRERSLFGSDFEIRLRNQLTQRAIARECADWIRRKARFKTNITHGSMNTFLNIKEGEETYTYMPFNEFTTTELGLDRGNNICPMVVGMPGHSSTDMFLKNFAELWKDKEKFQDVTDNVIENIETVYKENAPAFIYFITLYNIFNEFLEDISEDVLPNEATGFKSSVIWNKLYNFQRDASLAIINKLEKYNGCILADSVGLGKTFTALSVIKYYENRNRNVLVLCPKKLNDNWQTFRSNYKNNPVLADRLRYDILFHSDLSRDKGLSNGLDLERVNWGNYDLIVIDESHNFRNGGRFDNEDEDDDFKENRYARLMNKVIRSGVKTKVLMLSATPVNNRFSDLKNQLQLAYEGKAENINDLLDTGKNIDSIFRDAQTVYSKWAKLPPEKRTTEKLVDSLSYDFFQLLDAVTIARSRSHIIKYYNTNDVGKFPERLSPISRRPKLTDLNDAITFADIAEMLNRLNLSIYTPSLFIFESEKGNYGIDYEGEGLTVDGREKGIRKLMAINLLKRLESSVNSFRLTLTRIRDFINDSITAIDKFQESGAGTVDVTDFSEDFDTEDNENDPFVGRKSKINLRDMDYVSWRRDLKADLEVLELLILMLKDITPEHDTKLQQLVADLKNKFEHPINGSNKKVLIFTAFADTANYLYEQLSGRILNDCGLHTALITGSTEGKCTLPKLKCTFNDILTYFSPLSKDRDAIHPNDTREIDVLIATDCISEGQNLQDCDYLINYDIHWNPVRIIQRFGRIDRIGSKNDVIQLVNYWPDMELDDYIKLKGRVESRMKATVITSTGDDNLLSANEKGDLEYRRNQLKKLQNEVVDIEDMDTGVNIMDLGLNEFRLDLLANLKEHPNMDLTPFGMSAVVSASELIEPGVMYVLKNKNNGVNIDRSNLLHPFYMVYLSHTGTVICDHLSPKKLLDKMRYACKDKTEPDKVLCKQFNKETRDGKNMRHYSDLLQSAIESIITVKEESDIDDFLNGVQGNLFSNEIRGLDDFELICFLVIK